MIDLTVERELKSPNAWLWKHWRAKQKEREDWQTEIAIAMLRPEVKKALSIWTLLLAKNDIPGAKRVCGERRRVTVTRSVPSLRNFIRDDDNLRFSVKPLNDALKRLGLIHDDSRKWLEQTLPTQEVSTDGKYYTRITIESVSPSATTGQAEP